MIQHFFCTQLLTFPVTYVICSTERFRISSWPRNSKNGWRHFSLNLLTFRLRPRMESFSSTEQPFWNLQACVKALNELLGATRVKVIKWKLLCNLSNSTDYEQTLLSYASWWSPIKLLKGHHKLLHNWHHGICSLLMRLMSTRAGAETKQDCKAVTEHWKVPQDWNSRYCSHSFRGFAKPHIHSSAFNSAASPIFKCFFSFLLIYFAISLPPFLSCCSCSHIHLPYL